MRATSAVGDQVVLIRHSLPHRSPRRAKNGDVTDDANSALTYAIYGRFFLVSPPLWGLLTLTDCPGSPLVAYLSH